MISDKAYRILLAVIALVCLAQLAAFQLNGPGPGGALLQFLAVVSIAEWVRIDSKIYQRPVSRAFLFATLFLSLFTVPYHLYRTRKAFKTCVISLCIFIWLGFFHYIGLHY